MKIETKFNLNDEVWVMFENKPYSFRINEMKTISSIQDRGNYTTAIVSHIEYKGYGSHAKWYDESDLFASKEELKNYIFG